MYVANITLVSISHNDDKVRQGADYIHTEVAAIPGCVLYILNLSTSS